MTLNDFLAYKEFCPCCNSKLNFHCMSKSNHNIKYINNKLNIEIPIVSYSLSPIKKSSFSVMLILDMNSNEFEVDFLNAVNNGLDAVSIERLELFKTHCKGINPVSLYKECGICQSYKYSTMLIFNYASATVRDYNVHYEIINLEKNSTNKKYKFYNNFYTEKSTLIIGVDGQMEQQIVTSIIPITDPITLLNQFDMLLVFS